MCGIAGQVRREEPVDPELIERMCARLEHRGPDARGLHLEGGVGLGIQRLRVIDLETGDQPVYNEDGQVVVVLNGEIYNYAELRHRLRGTGHRFRTQGDTEVIVHLYEELGADCVRELHGMFAFALWDARRRLLLLARDRAGKKPLHYHLGASGISFASELQALLADPAVPRELDHDALDCYHAYGYVPAPRSAFRAVRKLPPAHTLVYRDGRAEVGCYWRLSYAAKHRGSPQELQAELRERITLAVRRRMVADVPVGAFLSGGIDSSAVVAAMAAASAQPVRTFAIGFAQQAFNELPYARRVSELFATEHQEFVVEPAAIELLPRLVRHYGEPFGDASAIPSFYLAELTSRHVTVALNGDGGDESFAGYNRYVSNSVSGRLERVPLGVRRAVAAAAARVPPRGEPRTSWNRARRLARSLDLTASERYARHMSTFDTAQRRALYTPEYAAAIDPRVAASVIADPWAAATGTAVLDKLLETDVRTYLPGDLLVKMDIATMAHSLEVRSPLLDHDVMELAAAIPAPLKLRGMTKKAVLRDALEPWLPADILDRPKMGFGVPLGDWFRHDLREEIREILLDPATLNRGYFRPEAIHRLLDEHDAGFEDHSARLWSLLFRESWQREVVDSAPGRTAGASRR